MKSVIPARASARALLVAVFGGALLSAGLVGLWSETRDVDPPTQPVASTVAVAPTIQRISLAHVPPAAPAPARQGGTAQSLPARLILASDVRAAAMSPFQLTAAGAAQDRALDCLTTAVYYEARGEGTDGMAAVAQVVLNRVRHPAFPKSVCGVVFQGCQFSFACGGMNGRRNAALWSRSREIAEAALGGTVMSRVGTATHFHATRLNPRWAGLSRVATIGRHVFYSFSGRRGAPATFLNVVSAGEPTPRTAPTRVEPPVYAMLPSEQPGAVSPTPAAVEAPIPPEPAATVGQAAPAPTAPIAGAAPLENAPIAPLSITGPTPVA